MRMTRRPERDDNEGGAVLVIVALGLVVILGMLALTLDLGRAVAVKRDMVNAADAAALAGAQECALGHGSAEAQAAATHTAGLNGAEDMVAFDASEECDTLEDASPKLVSVTFGKEMDYYVAPILGFDSVTVNASATALWGAATRSAPIPLRVDLNALLNCGVDPDSNEQVTCYLAFANNDPRVRRTTGVGSTSVDRTGTGGTRRHATARGAARPTRSRSSSAISASTRS